MSVIQETLPHPPQVVFEALITPGTYPEWLVGCREIRTVDEGWPAVETRFHHRVGVVGPLTVDDSTKVLAVDPPHELQLEVRFRPLGRGHVTFRLEPDGLQDTVVTIREEPLDHLAALKPVLDPLTDHRNRISLRRLAEHLDRVAAPA
jgi:uncharacterized protein YndB with AHSA1/START domain